MSEVAEAKSVPLDATLKIRLSKADLKVLKKAAPKDGFSAWARKALLEAADTAATSVSIKRAASKVTSRNKKAGK